MAWCSVKKHRDNYTFTFTALLIIGNPYKVVREGVLGSGGIAPCILDLGTRGW